MSDDPSHSDLRPCDALVIFGVTGDLARTKLFGALYDLALLDRLDLDVVGVARSAWDDDRLRREAETAILDTRGGDDGGVDDKALAKVRDSLTFLQGDYAGRETYDALDERLAGQVPLFYLAVPPSLFTDVAEGVASLSVDGARLLIEKPFGHDRASAEKLDAALTDLFDEDHLFRIDHFLGKEEVQNIELLRFANSFLEPLWNRHSIEAVTVTMAEERGVDDRGSFYDANGTVRDVVQNHLLQLLAVLAMEPPAGPSALQHQQAVETVLHAVSVASEPPVRMGQFEGYRDVEGVADDSTTETFVDVTFAVDNERWRGVPWRVIAGKGMSQTLTEVEVTLRPAPTPAFLDCGQPGSNKLWITIKPFEQVRLSAEVRAPGIDVATRPSELTTTRDYRDGTSPSVDAYALLFDAARRGDKEPFASIESVLTSWSVVDPILVDRAELATYPLGADGPSGA